MAHYQRVPAVISEDDWQQLLSIPGSPGLHRVVEALRARGNKPLTRAEYLEASGIRDTNDAAFQRYNGLIRKANLRFRLSLPPRDVYGPYHWDQIQLYEPVSGP